MKAATMLKPLALGAMLALGGCAASLPPVEVTRFHLNQPIAPGTVAIDSPGSFNTSLEFQTYAGAVGGEFRRLGFGPGEIGSSDYVASINVIRDTRAALVGRSPFSVGVGGGTGGYRSGVGVGLGFSFGGKPKDTVITQLAVQLKKRAGGDVVWEGRAETEAKENAPAAQPGIAAGKLAEALFRDFPGQSGHTISVK